MTDCHHCDNPAEVCRGCYERLRQEANDRANERLDSQYVALVRQQALTANVTERLVLAEEERDRLKQAIVTHHSQKADDRCIEDDDNLYAAAGLPPCDRRVGDKAEMLANCQRYIERRCEGGGWPSYRELEQECDRLRAELEQERAKRDVRSVLLDAEIEAIGVRFEDGCATPDDLRAVFNSHSQLLAKVNDLQWKHLGQKKAIELLQKGFESTCEQHDALKQSSRATAAECDRLRAQVASLRYASNLADQIVSGIPESVEYHDRVFVRAGEIRQIAQRLREGVAAKALEETAPTQPPSE